MKSSGDSLYLLETELNIRISPTGTSVEEVTFQETLEERERERGAWHMSTYFRKLANGKFKAAASSRDWTVVSKISPWCGSSRLGTAALWKQSQNDEKAHN